MAFKGVIINSLLVALFFVTIISVGTNMASNNNVNSTLLENTQINQTFTKMDETLTDFQAESIDRENLIRQDDPALVNDIAIFGIIKVALTLPVVILTIFTSIFTLIQVQLGIPNVVMYTFGAIVSIVIIAAGISLIRRGT